MSRLTVRHTEHGAVMQSSTLPNWVVQASRGMITRFGRVSGTCAAGLQSHGPAHGACPAKQLTHDPRCVRPEGGDRDGPDACRLHRHPGPAVQRPEGP